MWHSICDEFLAEHVRSAFDQLALWNGSRPTPRADRVGLGVGLAGSLCGDLVLGTVLRDRNHALFDPGRVAWAADVLWKRLATDQVVSPSLFEGHAGALWALLYSNTADFSLVKAAYLAFEAGFDEEGDRDHHYFDLISGVTGFLELSRLMVRRAADDTIGRSVASWLVERVDQNGVWRTPLDLIPSKQPLVAVEDYVDWGLAHGVPGAAVMLARYWMQLGQSERARRTLRDSTQILERVLAQHTPPAAPVIPAFTGERGVQYGNAAWCYGDIGVGAALGLCWLGLGDADAASPWIDIAAGGVALAAAHVESLDVGICHGIAGAALACARLFNASGDERFRGYGARILREALEQDRFDPEHVGREHGAGPLTGTSGVALALHACLGDAEPTWDSMLCLS